MYEFFGVIREVNGTVASGAYLEISYRDNVWYEPHIVRVRADGLGFYKLALRYYPYSGNFGDGDECEAVLMSVKVAVAYKSRTSQFGERKVRGSATNFNFRVNY